MGTIESYLQVVNKTSTNIVDITVYYFEFSDFDEYANPNTFNDLQIKRNGGSVTRRQDIAIAGSEANGSFTMDLIFSDGTEDTFTIHQNYVIGCCAGFEHKKKSHHMSYQRCCNRTLLIEVYNTKEQDNDMMANRIDNEGTRLFLNGDYKEALEKFEEGLKLANQSQTIDYLNKHKAEALRRIEREEAEEALKKLEGEGDKQDLLVEYLKKYNPEALRYLEMEEETENGERHLEIENETVKEE